MFISSSQEIKLASASVQLLPLSFESIYLDSNSNESTRYAGNFNDSFISCVNSPNTGVKRDISTILVFNPNNQNVTVLMRMLNNNQILTEYKILVPSGTKVFFNNYINNASYYLNPPQKGITYYDQIIEPSNPNVGDIWKERDSDNFPVKEWFWSGSVWLETFLKTTNLQNFTNYTQLSIAPIATTIDSDCNIYVDKIVGVYPGVQFPNDSYYLGFKVTLITYWQWFFEYNTYIIPPSLITWRDSAIRNKGRLIVPVNTLVDVVDNVNSGMILDCFMFEITEFNTYSASYPTYSIYWRSARK